MTHPVSRPSGGERPRLVHLTTTDISLALLLGPQLRAFGQAGYEVIGVSAPGPFVEEIEALGVRHVPMLHATRSMAPRDDALAMMEAYRLFRWLRPHIVHTHNPKPGIYGRLAARAAGVPLVVNTVHGLYANREDRLRKRSVVYGLERMAAACSDAELVQNPEDLETLASLRVPRSKLQLLGNGIDLSRFRSGDRTRAARERLRAEWRILPGDVVVGAVGRLVWEKGYGELFGAAAELKTRAPNVRFIIAGPADPGKGDAVSTAAIEEARRSGIIFLGHRADVEDLYAAFDIYVLASHREGFPRSAMEAAAMGLPMVATNIRGCRQVVDDGVTGLLVDPRNPHHLAGAIEKLVDDPDLRRSMGQAAAAKAVREFDQQRVIDLTLHVYRGGASRRFNRKFRR